MGFQHTLIDDQGQRKSMLLVTGDITQIQADAIVNAAKTSLLGGGGVDGAIHRAAGPELLAECRTLKGCPTGQARLTKGYRLPAQYVIHTVGPVWRGGQANEEQLLASAYHNSLELAQSHGLNRIAFPAISTGIYRYPKKQAAAIALKTVARFLSQSPRPSEVLFILFDEQSESIYRDMMHELFERSA